MIGYGYRLQSILNRFDGLFGSMNLLSYCPYIFLHVFVTPCKVHNIKYWKWFIFIWLIPIWFERMNDMDNDLTITYQAWSRCELPASLPVNWMFFREGGNWRFSYSWSFNCKESFGVNIYHEWIPQRCLHNVINTLWW